MSRTWGGHDLGRTSLSAAAISAEFASVGLGMKAYSDTENLVGCSRCVRCCSMTITPTKVKLPSQTKGAACGQGILTSRTAEAVA